MEIDRCQFCGGLWFDAGELEKVVGRPLSTTPVGGSTRSCAACRGPMAHLRVRGIEADGCRDCAGLYLDEGELQSILGGPVGFRTARSQSPALCSVCQERPPGPGHASELRGFCDHCAELVGANLSSSPPGLSMPLPAFPPRTGQTAWLFGLLREALFG